MKYKNKVRVLILVAGLLLSATGFAKSPVFKVSKGGEHIYIGGTIHLLSENDYPLPQGFQQAFDDAEHVYFETDTAQMSSPQAQEKIAAVMSLPAGKTLKSELSEKTYIRLERFLLERQIPIELFNPLTPAAVSFSLTVVELNRLDLGNPTSGVDHFFGLKTKEAENKTAFYLESIEEQINFLGKFNDADPDFIINSSIDDLSGLSTSWKKAIKAWREGDLEVMGDSLGADKLETDFPEFYKIILTDRNNRWLTKIKSMFGNNDIELVLVGALHLSNDDGLIEQLREGGYTIEQLD